LGLDRQHHTVGGRGGLGGGSGEGRAAFGIRSTFFGKLIREDKMGTVHGPAAEESSDDGVCHVANADKRDLMHEMTSLLGYITFQNTILS
jgi:hypothetical protein